MEQGNSTVAVFRVGLRKKFQHKFQNINFS